MTTTYRSYQPNQILMLPPSVSEWLPEGHLAHFVNDAVDALDLQAFHARYEGDGRRNSPFDPAMLVKVVVYGYANGVVSSRHASRWAAKARHPHEPLIPPLIAPRRACRRAWPATKARRTIADERPCLSLCLDG
jgi:hypothetical protein